MFYDPYCADLGARTKACFLINVLETSRLSFMRSSTKVKEMNAFRICRQTSIILHKLATNRLMLMLRVRGNLRIGKP